MTDLQSILFLCPMMFLAGFMDAIAGGGGLISLPAYIFTGMPLHNVYGCNKFATSLNAFLSAFRFVKNGIVDLKIAVPMGGLVLCERLGRVENRVVSGRGIFKADDRGRHAR